MKKSKSFYYTLWAGAMVFCVILSIFSLFFSACARQEPAQETAEAGGFVMETEAGTDVETEASAVPETEAVATGAEAAPDAPAETAAETAAPPSPVRLGETPDAGHEYLDRFIFLGDSTTYGIGYYYGQGYTDLCPPSQVWTPASGTLTLAYYNDATISYPDTGEELKIAEAVSRKKPEYLMITLGVNGISFMDEEWFKRDYTALVELVKANSPDTKIILNSMYPVAASYKHASDINNDKIRAANGWVEEIAAATGTRFLYSFETLVGPDGYLPEADQNGDGLHLTGEAFMKVMEYIRTHEYK